ncbi:hypothetical protein [uncultured Williamsia sp.]|uniref:hypothetical protein n=1 Tax=uncultured Williamsia sp. TaxID=259311 RepID=UPI0026101BD1|nr:hypothetical protein [uncultured Williamsia sp.]
MQLKDHGTLRQGAATAVAGLIIAGLLVYGFITKDWATAWLIGVPVFAIGFAINRMPAQTFNRRWSATARRLSRRNRGH